MTNAVGQSQLDVLAIDDGLWLRQEGALDDRGYVLTGAAAGGGADDEEAGAAGSRLLLETSRKDVFAAGDVRSGAMRRVAAAVGDGAMAVRLVHERLTEMGHLAVGTGR